MKKIFLAGLAVLILLAQWSTPLAAAPQSTKAPEVQIELDEAVLSLEEEGHVFWGNKKSGILHIDTCASLPKKQNRVALDGFAQGLEEGYSPCGMCLYWVNEDGTSKTVEEAQEEYIGNVKSRKFHRANCTSLPAEKNRVYFETRKEAVQDGYDGCGRCDP